MRALVAGLVVLAVAGWSVAGWLFMKGRTKPESYLSKTKRAVAEAAKDRKLKLWNVSELGELFTKHPKKARKLRATPVGISLMLRYMRPSRGRWVSAVRLSPKFGLLLSWNNSTVQQSFSGTLKDLPMHVSLVCWHSEVSWSRDFRKSAHMVFFKHCQYWQPSP